jgi:hypothetical protein
MAHRTVLLNACRLETLRQRAAAALREPVAAHLALMPRALFSTNAGPDLDVHAQQSQRHPTALAERRSLSFRSDTRLALAAPPLVYHPLYSAPQLPPAHRFPMVRPPVPHRTLDKACAMLA